MCPLLSRVRSIPAQEVSWRAESNGEGRLRGAPHDTYTRIWNPHISSTSPPKGDGICQGLFLLIAPSRLICKSSSFPRSSACTSPTPVTTIPSPIPRAILQTNIAIKTFPISTGGVRGTARWVGTLTVPSLLPILGKSRYFFVERKRLRFRRGERGMARGGRRRAGKDGTN